MRGLFLVAALIALMVSYTHETLIVLAYAYYVSGFIGELMARGRKPGPEAEARRRSPGKGRELGRRPFPGPQKAQDPSTCRNCSLRVAR